MANPVVAFSLLTIYTVGSFLQILIIIAIVKKVDYTTLSGQMLILSLAFSDLITCVSDIFGCTESLIGRHMTHYSAYIVGALNNISWFCSSLHMILMAWNRFVIICQIHTFQFMCTPKWTKFQISFTWFLTIIYSLSHLFICCPVVWYVDWVVSAYDFSRNETNLMATVDYSISLSTRSVPAILYVFVAFKICSLYAMTSESLGSQSTIDVKLCWQFVIILLAYLFLNVSWYVLPEFYSFNMTSIISYSLALNFTINPVVYLCFNNTLRSAVLELTGLKKGVTATKVKTIRKGQAGDAKDVIEVDQSDKM